VQHTDMKALNGSLCKQTAISTEYVNIWICQ